MSNTNSGRSIHLAWIVVEDFDKAIQYYTEVIGFKLENRNDEYGWAELSGHDGCTLGISKKSDFCPILPGGNAVLTITVANLEKAKEDMAAKGVQFLGDIQEVPGHVKLQLFKDPSGNHMQLVQVLAH